MTKQCPICSKSVTKDHAPFCSKRCQLRDLGQWLDGGYAIPSEEEMIDDLPEDEMVYH